MATRTNTSVGVGVDAHGGAVIDPTENVLALVEAAVKRQDDLRLAAEKFTQAELLHLRLTGELRAEHQRELSEKEANRLDAIRQVDVLNGNAAAKAASDAIAVLAATTATNAEKLRNDLNATASLMAKQTSDVATAMATQTETTVGAITDRLAALEKTSYQGAGRSAVADPLLADLIAEMKNVMKAQQSGAGKSEGIGQSWGVIVAVVAVAISAGALLFKGAGTAPVQPIVVTMPAPVTPTTTTTTTPTK